MLTERICRTDDRYPARMKSLRAMPQTLYCRGDLPDDRRASVAIIGARTCSGYGEEMAKWFAGELAACGVQIVSGMARGVDGIAQRAALDAGGRSFAVLGSGTDLCYPSENRELYERLLVSGGVVSEHPDGTKPLARHFPTRNRIISALADLVLVIEAREKSGTLITVDFALEQGRDVYALPGRISDGLSGGCNRLLRQGAGIALQPSDVLEALPYRPHARAAGGGAETDGEGKMDMAVSRNTDAGGGGTDVLRGISAEPFPDGADEVLKALGQRPVPARELYERLCKSAPQSAPSVSAFSGLLMELVLRGLIVQEAGNCYRKSGAAEFLL